MMPAQFAVLLAVAAVLLGQLPTEWRTLERATASGIYRPREAVVRTKAEWDSLWREHAGGRTPPDVDFTREMVVAVCLGGRPTAGYSVEIVGADPQGEALVIRYRETAPSPGAVTAQVLTAPCHLVAGPARSGPVRFERAS